VLPKGLSSITLPRWLRDRIGGRASATITPASAAEVRPNG